MITTNVFGPANLALNALNPKQIEFLQGLPKAELHAHLNGSIPLATLQKLAKEYTSSDDGHDQHQLLIKSGLERLQHRDGLVLEEIGDFFGLFPAIYALTSTPAALSLATKDVLAQFLHGEHPQCIYFELRTTPRITAALPTREAYLNAVLDVVESYRPDQAALMVSVDRRMSETDVRDCIDTAIRLNASGRRVVGVDLCGDPKAGDMSLFVPHFQRAKSAGLGITLHIAETAENPVEDTLTLLSVPPDRIGHATFLNDEARAFVLEKNIAIELCLSSNLLCKTVSGLDSHHILYWLERNHTISICSDDVLPFRTSLLGEYALLLAPKPIGLGLSEKDVRDIAQMGFRARFGQK